MIEIKDQIGREIRLEKTPKRIISLVPSQTELLADLGLDEQVVGITKFCVHPKKWFKAKKRVGGTKNVDLDKVKALKPDLIIANKEENAQPDIEQLQKEYPVYVSDIFNVKDALKMMADVGVLTNTGDQTDELRKKIKKRFKKLPQYKGRVLYFIWNKPYMVAGNNTFIGHLLTELGFENCLADKKARYVQLSADDVKKLNPDYILLSSEPFPFKEKHQLALEKKFNTKTLIVDGEMFSWYGSRMLKMKDYFKKLDKQL